MTPPCVECKHCLVIPILFSSEIIYRCKATPAYNGYTNPITGQTYHRICEEVRMIDGCELFKPKTVQRILNWFRRRK